MKNYIQAGDAITVTAPYAVASGDGMLVGALFLVATGAAANGAVVEGVTEGVFDITTLGTDTGAVGTKMYWDNAAKRLTTTLTSNTFVGHLIAAKTNGPTTSRVRLHGASI
jgi:predicted RecA/RadA family phage recombinase